VSEDVSPYDQNSRRTPQAQFLTVDGAKNRVQKERKDQHSNDAANEQTARENIVPTEIERADEQNSGGQVSGPGGSSAGSFPKEFIDIGDFVMLRHEGPDKCANKNRAEVTAEAVHDRASDNNHGGGPNMPADLKGEQREQVDRPFQN
jgi:hypothetical protein